MYPPEKGDIGGFKILNFIPYNTHLKEKARENRKNPTIAEKIFWCNILKASPFNKYKFTKQKPLLTFIVDFYCSSLSLAIEVDGDTHAQQVQYDLIRAKNLNRYGVRLIRYTNHDILHNLDGVYEDLKNKLFIKER